ncbi:MAG: hypothetical protein IMZ61_07130 [Planctomycetes bacterium]|nr:hypothetical protein [Planctomycetota bacterium]
MTLKNRLNRLQDAIAPEASTWQPVMLETRDFPTQAELDAECLRIETQARAAGWTPGAGVCMIIVDCGEEITEINNV